MFLFTHSQLDAADLQLFFDSAGRERTDKEVANAYDCYESMLAYTNKAADKKVHNERTQHGQLPLLV